MSKSVKRLEADVVVVGSGPGGSTVAKEMSQRGKKVILMEQGAWVERFKGNLSFPVRGMQNRGWMKTIQGDSLIVALRWFLKRCVGFVTTNIVFSPTHLWLW